MRLRASTLAVTTAVVTALTGTTAAFAAVPSNDTSAGAVSVVSLPFSATVDTSGATTDSEDTALNAQCGAPATERSVWYTYTAPTGVDGIVVDVSQSGYSAGAIVAEPDGAGGWNVDACGPGTTGTYVVPGTTYRILAFSDTAGVSGGQLRITIDEAVVPTIDVAVNPRGKVDKAGNALISGTYTCTGSDYVELFTQVKQPVGRFAINGDGYSAVGACDGVQHTWESTVVPNNGKFAGGKAATFIFGFTCGPVFCADGFVEQTVKLSK